MEPGATRGLCGMAPDDTQVGKTRMRRQSSNSHPNKSIAPMTDSPKSPARAPMRLQRQTMAGQVADELRHKILGGEYAEGEQLLQEQLAADFGIRKVPVREALHQLAAEGFVEPEFHRGAPVAGLSAGDVMEVFELRTLIEVWLLELGMAAATEHDVHVARDMAREIDQIKDPADFPDLKWRVHEAL